MMKKRDQKVYNQARHESYRRYGTLTTVLTVFVPAIIYGAILVFAPSNILNLSEALNEVSLGIGGWVAAKTGGWDIFAHARTTRFPQIAILTSALGALLVVWIAVILMVYGWVFHDQFLVHEKLTAKDILIRLLLLPPFGLLIYWAIFCLGGDPSFAKGFTTASKLGYFLMTMPAILMLGAGIGIWPRTIRLTFGK